MKVYNTLSRELEEFKPIKEGQIRVYVCGLTTYDLMHIGHARTYIAFDVIFRYLRYRGYDVRYVQNITDIDDKIIRRAGEKGVDPLKLSSEFAEKALEYQDTLGLSPADEYPKVSAHIQDIIEAVQVLIDKNHAYIADGSVYFDVPSFPDYGKLSNQKPEQLSQHRIEPDPNKKNPLDFALWKKAASGELGFESPWGYGRPGWHIECSVMSRRYLGARFDIHGGALDLVFPHHENEIAQSEALTGEKPFVKYWLHTGFLHSSGEKMSKSLGNIISVRDFLKEHTPKTLRLFVLQTHYRSPVDYSEERIEASEKAVERLRTFRRELDMALSKASSDGGAKAKEITGKLREAFVRHMDDDFNTPQALAAVFEAIREINSLLAGGGESKESLEKTTKIFDELMDVLGFDLKSKAVDLGGEEKKLIEKRNKLRAEKKWAEADKIRNLLIKHGIKLVDRKDGTTIAEKIPKA